MDFHALSRRDLQALSKRNGIKANQTNAAMADALAALPSVDGIEEYVQQPVAEPASAAKPAVQAAEAEEEERVAPIPDEVIILDDSEEEEEKEEVQAPALGVGRSRATRRARVEPVEAPALRKRAAARKTEKEDMAAEDVQARTTRGRSQRTAVSVAEDEAPKARSTSRRAVARKTGAEQKEEEEATQGGASEVEAAVSAPASSYEEDDIAANLEAVRDAPNEEQFPAAEAETAKVVPTRTTRARSQRTAVSAAAEEAPKARPTSRRAVARKTGTEQKEEEDGTQGGVSEVEAAVSAPASSHEGDDSAANMEAVMDALNDEQFAAAEAETAKVVPTRATRARSQRTAVSVAEEEAPKARRTSRRAVARKTSNEQEEEERVTQGDVETAAPEPVSSEKGRDGAEEICIEAHSEKQNKPAQEPVEAGLARRRKWTTRARSRRTVMSVPEREAPKARRTSRRASTEQEVEENGTQGDVSDMEVAASSDKGADGAEEIEATIDVQNEKQFAAVEAVPARATRARRQRTVVSVAVKEAPKARRTSRRTGTMQDVQGQQQKDIASDVAAPVSSDEGGDGAEETEANEEQYKLVEEQSGEDEMAVGGRTPLLEEEEPVAEDCPVDSSVEEQTDTVSSEEIQHSSEDKETVPAEEVDFTGDTIEENEDAEEEPAVAEHVESPVQEQLVDVQLCEATDEEPAVAAHVESVEEQLIDVQQCEATEEIQLESEDAEMVPVDALEADFTSDVDHASGENEDCTAGEEPQVEEHVDSSVQEPLVDVQQCEAAEKIHLASEGAEMVPIDALEADFTSDVDHASEENEDCAAEEEPQVQEPLVDIQQCEAIEKIHLASEDAEMVPVDEVPQATLTCSEATEQADFTSDADHTRDENEDGMVEEEAPVADDVDAPVRELPVQVQQCDAIEKIHLATEENEDCTVEEELQVAEDVLQCEATEDVHLVGEDTEMVNVKEVLQATLESGEVTEEIDTTDADEENEEVLQSAAKASENKEDMAADEVTNNTDVAAEEETVHASEENEVPNPEEVLHISAKANKEKEDMVAVEVQQWSEAMYEEVVEVDTVDEDDSGLIADLTDVSMDEEAMVANEMPQSSATMVVTVENLSEVTVTDDEWAVTLSAWLENLSRAKVTENESAVKEVVTAEEVAAVENLSQATVTDDEWAVTLSAWLENLSRAKVTENVGAVNEVVTAEEVTAVENLLQAKEIGVTDDLQPAFDAARDFSDHVASPQSANVFEDAAKSLSMDSITAKPTVSEPADVPLCVYSHSVRKMKITEPMSLQREKEVKLAKRPEALGSISVRKLKMNKADDRPLCMYSNSGDDNNTFEAQETEAVGNLSLRKLRTEFNEIVAVAQENNVVKEGKKSSTPLDTLSLGKLRLKLKETLTAQNQKTGEPTRVPLGRLDENAY